MLSVLMVYAVITQEVTKTKTNLKAEPVILSFIIPHLWLLVRRTLQSSGHALQESLSSADIKQCVRSYGHDLDK